MNNEQNVMPPMMHYGLRYFEHGGEVKLIQIAGGGRIRVASASRKWWIDPAQLMEKAWEVFETDSGQYYDTPEEAQQVIINLTSPPR